MEQKFKMGQIVRHIRTGVARNVLGVDGGDLVFVSIPGRYEAKDFEIVYDPNEQELSGEELEKWLRLYCRMKRKNDHENCEISKLSRKTTGCTICGNNTKNWFICNYNDIQRIIAKFKAEQEAKAKEIETEFVWTIRIISGKAGDVSSKNKVVAEQVVVLPDGFNRLDGEERVKEAACEFLKRYCKGHDGDYFAIWQGVARVRAQEVNDEKN